MHLLTLILLLCLIIQLSLGIKLISYPGGKRLNKYLAIVPLLFSLSTAIEIDMTFETDAVFVNRLFQVYQCLAFFPIIFYTLTYIEYLKTYTRNSNRKFLTILQSLVIGTNLIWILLLVLFGPSAKLFLAQPGMWSIDMQSVEQLFLCHTYSSIVWLLLSLGFFTILAVKAGSKKKSRWFTLLAVFQLISVSGIIYFIMYHHEGNAARYDMVASIPCTLIVFVQAWVLSNFTLFDVNPATIYADAMASVNDWLLVLDKEGRLLFLNNAVLKNTDRRYHDLLNLSVDKFMEIELAQSNEIVSWKFLPESREGDDHEIIIRLKPSGRQFYLKSSLKPINMPDGTIVFLWVLVDTTGFKALLDQKSIIEVQAKGLTKANSEMGLLMRMVSHDLKAPLKTILELVDMSREDARTGSSKRFDLLTYIQMSAEQSLDLAVQMIEYLRISAVEKKKVLCNVPDMITLLKQRFISSINKSEATIVYTGPEQIVCDTRHLSELFANLIDNSLKYRAGSQPVINITLAETENMYEFVFRDNGPGMQSEILNNIFSEQTTLPPWGTNAAGLGLLICKQIVVSNQGELYAINNSNGNGISIFFSLEK